ncbi:hypothetical protein SPBR_09042 [Sporothrix brasiliensis 5110]|uniref:Uncharacterized protein n=1 Tax=Sporothrix brasiliensis 5110 TaxID=1398154 RepID=A0A0C2IND3_9PEZI|nr:uncharacterized protein SPBR_09042 [Sporothrix brasiliensis 5110]KIH90541.1 hypothetical protein SPBR_09042 [Sporothrix brasiliensis 5110]
MAALHLMVDFGDETNEEKTDSLVFVDEKSGGDTKSPKGQKKKRGSLLSLPWAKKEAKEVTVPVVSPQSPWKAPPFTGGTGYTERKIATLLCDFLQPDSKLSNDEVVTSILALIPANAPSSRELQSFGALCVGLAEQVPYHHPSQLKFARLLRMLAKSPKFLNKYRLDNTAEDMLAFFQHFRNSLTDASGLDEEFPYDWVNINAFEAKLCAIGIWGTTPGQGFIQLRYVFEQPKRLEATAFETNTEIMAAAQWIIWFGQSMFNFFLYDEGSESSYICDLWNEEGTVPFQPRSLERWRFWAKKFDEVGSWSDATDECKDLTARAARIMHALEENMVFSV